ncbi:hypothetical protein Moror_15848 [Moniliophthora roreri MCA 2997]|uniref:Uncharacterized protein n=1 Tax=Moniliophthora roreri (strain MCA 2997) TaxID=1381753 RepID=V2W4H6_MONRO|nr:hypothetical protein Moror_15848 [Moniliophthora roreri MCA 2997]
MPYEEVNSGNHQRAHTIMHYRLFLFGKLAVQAVKKDPLSGRPIHNGYSITLNHNHKTGRLQGFIYKSYNSAIGVLEDRLA